MFDHTGAVEVAGGTLALLGGGTATGTFTGSNGATLEFGNTTYTVSSTSNIDVPRLRLSSGALNITQPLHISQELELRGGVLNNSAELVVDGPLTWAGGTIKGSGHTTARGDIGLSGDSALDGQRFDSTATTIWTGSRGFGLLNGAVFTNLPGATFEARNDAAINLSDSARFVNAGSFRKLGTTGTTTIRPAFDNSGTVEIGSGTLALLGGGSASGSFSGAAGTTLDIGPAPYTLSATSRVDVPNIRLGQGPISVNGAYNASQSTTHQWLCRL